MIYLPNNPSLISAVVTSKAQIKVSDSLTNSDDGIKCLFNPSDFTIERSVNYAEHKIPGKDRPIMQFVNGEAETMSFSLFFDTYMSTLESGNKSLSEKASKPITEKEDVREYTNPFYKLMDIDSDEHSPKIVTFVWGLIKFEGVVANISQKFTLFSPSGIPLRAVLTITLKSYAENNPVRNSPDRTKNRVVVEGEQLYSLAYREYGDCSMWRKIAEANSIDNPRRLRSGENISVPSIT